MTPQLAESLRELGTATGALLAMCIAKGVFTEAEFNNVKAHLETQFDQQQAAAREEFLKTEEGKATQFLANLFGKQI